MRGCQADASSDRCLQGRCRLPPHAPLPSPLLPACCRRFCTSQLYTRAMETCGIGRAGRLWVAAGICSNEWLLSRCGSAEDASHCVRRDPSCPAAGSRHSPLQDHAHTRQSTRNAPKNPVSSGNEPSGSCAPPVAPTHPGREPACPRIPSAPPQRQSTGPSPTRQVICPCPSIHPRLPPPPHLCGGQLVLDVLVLPLHHRQLPRAPRQLRLQQRLRGKGQGRGRRVPHGGCRSRALAFSSADWKAAVLQAAAHARHLRWAAVHNAPR